jgi:hypothetical protein
MGVSNRWMNGKQVRTYGERQRVGRRCLARGISSRRLISMVRGSGVVCGSIVSLVRR